MESLIAPLKFATAFLSPLGFSLLLALLGLALNRRWIVLLAVAWLWAWSTPIAAGWISRTLEWQNPIRSVAALPSADAIVILGGGMYAPVLPWFPEPNLSAAGDRIVLGAQLWRAGKAPFVLYTGGSPGGLQAESVAGAKLLTLMGVPEAAIVQEGQSQTTRENVSYSLPLLRARGVHKVLLVSSGWHLPRALANFKSAAPDIEWIAAACDPYAVGEVGYPGSLWMPNSNALDVSRNAFKEWLGIAWARLHGH